MEFTTGIEQTTYKKYIRSDKIRAKNPNRLESYLLRTVLKL